MRKVSIFLLALSAALFALSCQKVDIEEHKEFSPMTINAMSEVTGAATKAEMVYRYDITWSENDRIYVSDGASNDTFTLTDGAGTTKGRFTQDGSASFRSEVKAYYPSTLVKDGKLIWPANQNRSQIVPMYSEKVLTGTGAEDFSFTSLGAILQIVFSTKSENVVLKTIRISDASRKMSGEFTVDEEGRAVIASTGDNAITLDLGDGAAVGVAAKYFNIAIPAGNYKDLTIRFTANDGRMCVMHSTTFPELEHNTVGRLTLAGNFDSDAYVVDLGLSVKWASVNVGAGKPEDLGDLFAWGETTTKENYDWGPYKFNDPRIYYTMPGEFNPTHGVTKYCTSVSYCYEPDNKTVLELEDDAAHVLWGGPWQMPTLEQMKELKEKCRWNWVSSINGSGTAGYKVTGPNGKFIYIPAAGERIYRHHNEINTHCNLWTKNLIEEDNQYAHAFCAYYWNNEYAQFFCSGERTIGYSVRPVLAGE